MGFGWFGVWGLGFKVWGLGFGVSGALLVTDLAAPVEGFRGAGFRLRRV